MLRSPEGSGDRLRAPQFVVCDLDGVVWNGDDVCPGAPEAIAQLRTRGVRIVFLTNSAARSRSDVAARLESMDVPARPGDVITGAVSGARLLSNRLPIGSPVLVVGTDALIEAVAEVGLIPVSPHSETAERDIADFDAVIVGLTPKFGYTDIAVASAAVRSGAWLVATNGDPTFPHGGGQLPGAGALVSSIETASGVNAAIAGKPGFGAYLALREWLVGQGVKTLSCRHQQSEMGMASLRHDPVIAPIAVEGVVIGDRRSTDGAFAQALGWPFIEVRSVSSESPSPVPVAVTVPSLLDAVAGVAG